MSVTTAELRIDATQATQALNKVTKQVEGLGASFGRLRNLVSGVAFGAVIRNALLLADSIDDVAKATGLATTTVIGFGQAIAQNGGTIADAQTALTRLSQTISEAQSGNQNAITSFNELGISLNDLATLSDEQILQKVIKELGNITDKGDQARLSMDILGKTMRGVDFTGTAQDIGPAIENSKRYAESNKSAADAAQNLQVIQTKLTQELLLTLQPISNLIKSIDANSESFMRFYNAAKQVVAVLSLFFIVGRVVKGFQILRDGINAVRAAASLGEKEFTKYFGTLFGWVKNWRKVMEIVTNGIKKAQKGLEDPKTKVPEYYEKRLKYWTNIKDALDYVKKAALGAAAAVATLIAGLTGYNADIETPKAGKNARGAQDRIDRDKKLEAEAARLEQLQKAYTEGVQKVDAYTTSLNKELLAISKNIDLQKEAIQNGEKLTQIKDVERQVTEKIADAQERYKEMLLGLDPKNENQKKLIDYINGQIAALKRKEAAMKAAGKTAVEELQKEQQKYEDIGREIEAYKRMQEQNLAMDNLRAELELLGLVGQEREKAAEKLKIEADLKAKLTALLAEEIALHTRFNQLTAEGQEKEREAYQKSLADIARRRSEAEQAAKDETKINEQKWQKIGEIENNGLKGFQDRLKELKETLTTYDIGQAFADSIIRAIETGKFHLKTFLLEMIQMWIQQKAKLAAVDLFGKFISPVVSAAGGAIGSFIGKLFGLAEGGPARANQPYIVGERGPELFVPNTSGSVIPNHAMGKGIGAGAVSAPITNNYITNNINAVDAKSVAQLFAENRKTLLGSVRMAEKEMPYSGRM